jgi:hypothetical protein
MTGATRRTEGYQASLRGDRVEDNLQLTPEDIAGLAG